MSVYKKIQQAKVDLQNRDIQKTGSTKHYDYFELDDFMPHVKEIFLELGLFSKVSFGEEKATLIIVDVENTEEKVEYDSPMKTADLPNCHPIQNLGAVETYQRRYLYMNALDISEKDALDITTGNENKTAKTTNNKNKSDSKSITDETEDKIDSLIDVADDMAEKMSRSEVKSMLYSDFADEKGWKKFFIADSTDEKMAKQFLEYLQNRLGDTKN